MMQEFIENKIENYFLLNYINELLNCKNYFDICPNGMQIEGKKEIKKIATGVTASYNLFEKAKEKNCDLILVHHGIFINNQNLNIQGILKKKIQFLLKHDINLFCYHLPLDAHEKLGNNILIAQKLNLTDIVPFGLYKSFFIGYLGFLKEKENIDSIFKKFKFNFLKEEKQNFTLYPFGKKEIKKIAIISGAGTSFLEEAIEKNCDLFISGEVKESSMHIAKEAKINFLALGHYNSEIFGIKALGHYIEKKFNIQHEFISIKNCI